MGSLMKSRLFLTVVLMDRCCFVGSVTVRDMRVSSRTEEKQLKMRRAGVDRVPCEVWGQ